MKRRYQSLFFLLVSFALLLGQLLTLSVVGLGQKKAEISEADTQGEANPAFGLLWCPFKVEAIGPTEAATIR